MKTKVLLTIAVLALFAVSAAPAHASVTQLGAMVDTWGNFLSHDIARLLFYAGGAILAWAIFAHRGEFGYAMAIGAGLVAGAVILSIIVPTAALFGVSGVLI